MRTKLRHLLFPVIVILAWISLFVMHANAQTPRPPSQVDQIGQNNDYESDQSSSTSQIHEISQIHQNDNYQGGIPNESSSGSVEMRKTDPCPTCPPVNPQPRKSHPIAKPSVAPACDTYVTNNYYNNGCCGMGDWPWVVVAIGLALLALGLIIGHMARGGHGNGNGQTIISYPPYPAYPPYPQYPPNQPAVVHHGNSRVDHYHHNEPKPTAPKAEQPVSTEIKKKEEEK